MEARDIMTREVVFLTPEATVEDAADLLIRYRIHGAPVVDKEDQLVGMVSLMDLVGRSGSRVRDIMSVDPVQAGEDAPIEDLAGMMIEQMVRRIPIVEGGRVVGIVSASDIVQVFLNLHEARPGTMRRQEEAVAKPKRAARR